MRMIFDPPLITATLMKRYKRFLIDAQLETGEIITAHCANSGSMLGINQPGLKIWLQPLLKTQNKLPYRLELVEVDNTLVCANTMNPNKIVERALFQKKLPMLGDYTSFKREVKYGANSRIDFLLEYPDQTKGYVEVKSVHLKHHHTAMFPDSVTARGTKHLEELMQVSLSGHKAFVVFIIQRHDCQNFSAASHIDPIFSQTLSKAAQTGVKLFAFHQYITQTSLEISTELPILGI